MDKETLIANYFSNRLTQEEESRFNDLLDTDSNFKAQFDFEKNLQQAISAKENQNLKAKLISFEADIVKDAPKSSRGTKYKYLAIAASVVLLIGLAWMGFSDGSSDRYDDLYASNFHEYPNTVFTITRGDNTASLERDAFVAYESKDYETAIVKFEQIDLGVEKSYADFYIAQSYLNLNQLTEAKNSFKKTIAKNSEFIAESYWYLGLIALKEKNKIVAIEELTKLTNKYDFNKEKALEILEELD
ncbi:MAG: tetratricopeptide repeat protein [Maribacter sp.]